MNSQWFCNLKSIQRLSSLLGPVLANLFFGHHEKIWSDEFKSFEVILCRWYIDDIICLFSCEKVADEFCFTFVNSRHPNIKFLFEKEKDYKIAFLDVYIRQKAITDFSPVGLGKVLLLVNRRVFWVLLYFRVELHWLKPWFIETIQLAVPGIDLMMKFIKYKFIGKKCILPIWLKNR